MAVTAAEAACAYTFLISSGKWSMCVMTTAHDTGATSLSRDRELRDDELDAVTGGVLSLSFTKVMFENTPISTSSAAPPAKHWFNGG